VAHVPVLTEDVVPPLHVPGVDVTRLIAHCLGVTMAGALSRCRTGQTRML
jgi:hypothetical protein